MGKKKIPKKRRTSEPAAAAKLLRLDNSTIEKRFHIFAVVALLIFAAYQSITYFGHLAVPSSDFPAFIQTAKELLSFKLPGSFKRLPLLGVMQVLLGKLIGGSHPELTAGHLQNALLHCANVVLLYLIGRKLIGKAAFFFALLIAINPSIIELMVDPIAETTLIFFILLTFFFILKRSNLCYLFAAMAAMTRYEGAALIFTALVIDMITRKTKKQRLTALAYASLASIPFALWMIGTVVSVKAGKSHYVGHFANDRGHIGIQYFNVLWETTFKPLFQLPSWVKAVFVTPPTSQGQADAIISATKSFAYASKSIAVFAFAISIPYAMIKRNLNYLALMIFFVCYVGVHSMRFTTLPRYTIPVIWMAMLFCCYGLKAIFDSLNHRNIPKPLRFSIHLIFALIAAIWLVRLLPFLHETKKDSPNSEWIPWVALFVTVLTFGFLTWLYRTKNIYRTLMLTVLICLAVTSNQFILVKTVGQGKKDAEFKMLTEWYVENAQPGEKLLSTMNHVMSLFAPKQAKYFFHTGGIQAENISQFIDICYERNYVYIAWDSRIGHYPNDSYYKRWKMQKVQHLGRPQSIGPFEFITQIKRTDRRYINIFRLRAKPTLDNKTNNN